MKNGVKIKYGLYGTRKNPAQAVEDAMQAERLGFDSYWFTDHLIDDNVFIEHGEIWGTLGAISVKTDRIMIASGVTDPFRRHPAVTAQAVATLDNLSGGRAMLGIGAGERMNLAPFGICWSKPVTRLREAIEVIIKLWSSTPNASVEYRGECFKLHEAFLQIGTIRKPRPPIFLGALSQKTRQLAGELADGWMPWINTPETFVKRLKDVEEGARKAGRRQMIKSAAVLELAISEDIDKARGAVDKSARCSLICERDTLSQMGYEIKIPDELSIQRGLFTLKTMEILTSLSEKIPDKAVDAITAYGTPEDCIRKIERFVKAGATYIIVANSGPDHDYTLRVMGEKIIPYFEHSYGI